MKKLLVLGGSNLQMPGIEIAKSKNIYTIVVDGNPNVPAKKVADEFYNVSTMDYEKILCIAKKRNIDGILTIASDQPMNVISKIGEAMGLKTISVETASICTNKGLMREVLRKEKINIPQFEIANNFENFNEKIKLLKLPLIVKPVNSSGSRGVQLVKDLENINEIFNYSSKHSPNHTVIIEEYINGREFSVETMTFNGSTEVIAITQKVTSGPPYFVEIQHVIPGQVSEEEERKIKSVVLKTVKAMGINNGPSHCEVMLTEEVYIIEIGARLGGDSISTKLVPLATGYDMVATTIDIALGIQPKRYKKEKNAALIQYHYTENDGIFEGISSFEALTESPFLYENAVNLHKHQKVHALKSSLDRIGYYILKGNNTKDLINEVNNIEKRLLYKIKGGWKDE